MYLIILLTGFSLQMSSNCVHIIIDILKSQDASLFLSTPVSSVYMTTSQIVS